MKPKFFLFLAGLFGLAASAHATSPTATLAADSVYLLPQGGTAVLTVTIDGYSGTTSSLGVSLTLPANWSYTSATGGPEVKPLAGDTGTLGWAYTAIPTAPASFSFTVTYPASAGTPSLTAGAIVRDGGTRTDLPTNTVNFLQATAPVITNTDPAAATYGSSYSFNITATSPIPISGYDAVGLPAGLSVNPSTGLISGTPTVSGGPFTVTLKATNAVDTTTKDVALTVNKAAATIYLGDLAPVYDGTPKPVSTSTSPTGLTVNVLYAGATTVPTNAGDYAVTAEIADANYAGTAAATLTIHKASQTIGITLSGPAYPGQTITVTAIADSGLPVTLSLISGPATLQDNQLTITGTGDIVIRAVQAGDANHSSKVYDYKINSQKLAQTIAFAALPDKLASDDPFDLHATASSGLPVSFTLVSGPAQLSDHTVTLNRVAGKVTVRASQAGNDVYLPAPDVVRTFKVTAVTDSVYFGDLVKGLSAGPGRIGARDAAVAGQVAAVLPAGSQNGSLLIVAPEVGLNELIGFTVAEDGSFTLTATQQTEDGPQTVTGTGQFAGATLTGSFAELGFSFTTQVEAEGGPSTDAQGLYISTALDNAQGTTYTIIGANDNVLVLVVTPTLTFGGLTTLAGDRSFNLASGVATLTGSVDTVATTVSTAVTTIVTGGGTTIDFGGLKNTTARTDRLIALSSRARVGAGEKVLIAGFVINGSDLKSVLIRAVGPGLGPLGVTTPLANPRIRLVRGDGRVMATNDDWSNSADPTAIADAAARVGAFPLNAGSTDSALLATLSPGVYTAIVSGGDGVALAEIYDASLNPQADYQRLIDISARADVSTGEGTLIGGLVITGNSPKQVLIRGVGPTLATQGIQTPLADPVLKVFQGGTVIGSNDNWGSDPTAAAAIVDAETKTGAFHLLAGSKDAATIMNLAPGLYTVHVVPAPNTPPGVALVEIYEIPPPADNP